MVWHPSVRFSVCMFRLFDHVISRTALSQRYSPGGSTRRGQRTFPSEYYETKILISVGGHVEGRFLYYGVTLHKA